MNRIRVGLVWLPADESEGREYGPCPIGRIALDVAVLDASTPEDEDERQPAGVTKCAINAFAVSGLRRCARWRC